MLHVWTVLEAFVKMSLRSLFFSGEFFSGKHQNFQCWDKSPQVLNYQDYCTKRHQINGFCSIVTHSILLDMCELYPAFQKLKSLQMRVNEKVVCCKKKTITQGKPKLGHFLGYEEKPPRKNPSIWEYLK